MGKTQLQFFVLFLFAAGVFAQPYVDVAGFTYQHFGASYKDNPSLKNQTEDYLFHVFYPRQLKNGNVLLLKLNGELLQSSINTAQNQTASVSSLALSIGYQWVSKNKRWKTIAAVVPKLASDFNGKLLARDFQYGGILMESYTFSDDLKLKPGLYYNREAFGNFFVPFLGLDWKATDRICLYGILPSNYKVEYNAIRNRLYTGIDFKWLTRSFNLSGYDANSYMRFEEIFLKGFAEFNACKNIVLSAEAGYAFGKSPLQYATATDMPIAENPVYQSLKNYAVFNVGIFYRIRNESTR